MSYVRPIIKQENQMVGNEPMEVFTLKRGQIIKHRSQSRNGTSSVTLLLSIFQNIFD